MKTYVDLHSELEIVKIKGLIPSFNIQTFPFLQKVTMTICLNKSIELEKIVELETYIKKNFKGISYFKTLPETNTIVVVFNIDEI
jgi:hypothetical protein